MKDKGQGMVWFWISALVGVILVIATYTVFDTVLFSSENSLETALIPLGLNTTSSVYIALKRNWGLWPVVFIFAWALALFVRAFIKEPEWGLR